MPKKSNHEIKFVVPDDLFKDIQQIADTVDKPLNVMVSDWLETIVNTIEYGSHAFYCDYCKEPYFYKGFFLEAECPHCKE